MCEDQSISKLTKRESLLYHHKCYLRGVTNEKLSCIYFLQEDVWVQFKNRELTRTRNRRAAPPVFEPKPMDDEFTDVHHYLPDVVEDQSSASYDVVLALYQGHVDNMAVPGCWADELVAPFYPQVGKVDVGMTSTRGGMKHSAARNTFVCPAKNKSAKSKQLKYPIEMVHCNNNHFFSVLRASSL